MRTILFIFPNAANWAIIPTAFPILSGIVKNHGNWKMEYFDTYLYKKSRDSTFDKETAGGFKPGFIKQKIEYLPYDDILPDLQKRIDSCNPDIIAITGLSHDYEFFMSFFPSIKIPPKAPTVENIQPTHMAHKRPMKGLSLGPPGMPR